MRTRNLAFLAIAAALIMALWGCGSNRDSDRDITGEGTDISEAATVGIDNCLICHGTGEGEVGSEWLASRHANALIIAQKNELNPQTTPPHVDDPEPDYGIPDRCLECHDRLGDGRRIDDALAAQSERPIISCESCHGGGQFHRGVGPIPFPTPGPDQCGQCHGVTAALFHSTSAVRNITDTHDDLASTADLVEGYNVKVDEQTGCVDCHYGAHEFDLTINNQWAASGHGGNIKTVKEAAQDAGSDLAAVKAVGIDGEPFIHDFETNGWDNTEESGSCQRCHTATGGMNFLNDPNGYDPQNNDFSHLANWSAETGSPETELIYCWVCHSDSDATIRDPGEIPFPSGAVLSLEDGSNPCMACHQGRESGVTVANAIAANPGGPHRFINRHYFAAAAIMFGTEATAGFEYEGRTYLGRTPWPGAHTGNNLDTCRGCHLRGDENNHSFVPDITRCDDCHQGITDFEEIGLAFGDPNVDYDGDGVGESFQAEIDGMEALLLTAIQNYARDVIGTPIIYLERYPYWFADTNDNGTLDEGEGNYTSLDDKLLAAAYNYHSNQDPCSDIHNYKYVLQTAYDSIDDIDGVDRVLNNSVQGTAGPATRPETPIE